MHECVLYTFLLCIYKWLICTYCAKSASRCAKLHILTLHLSYNVALYFYTQIAPRSRPVLCNSPAWCTESYIYIHVLRKVCFTMRRVIHINCTKVYIYIRSELYINTAYTYILRQVRFATRRVLYIYIAFELYIYI